MTRDEVSVIMQQFFKELEFVREAGQKEYAHDESNAFRNFEDTGKDLGIDRKKVLWIFMKKHLDGIKAAINGHVSQREPVEGRIKDAVMYLILLLAMFKKERTIFMTPDPKENAAQERKLQGSDQQQY